MEPKSSTPCSQDPIIDPHMNRLQTPKPYIVL